MENTSIITSENVKGYIDENGTAWIDAEAVARGWGFTQNAKSGNVVVRWERVNAYLKEFGFIPTSGDDVKAGDFLPENMVYRLGFKANNKKAQAFQAKLADEIIPSIRKTGSYSLDTPSYQIEDRIARAKKWIEEEEARQNLLVENNQLKEELAEEAEFRAKVFDTTSCITYTDAAKILKAHFKKFGRKKLIDFLKDIKAINQNNIPYDNQIGAGRFVVKEKFINPNGYEGFTKKQGYLTQKGVDWILKNYKEVESV